jgi:hypothetical protein
MMIVFNGQEYSSLDDMPADVRDAYQRAMAAFADSDGNGVPDIFEQEGKIHIQTQAQTYTNLNDMPADVRQTYEQAISAMSGFNLNTIADGVGMGARNAPVQVPNAFESVVELGPAAAVYEPQTGRLLVVVIMLIVALAFGGGAAAFSLIPARAVSGPAWDVFIPGAIFALLALFLFAVAAGKFWSAFGGVRMAVLYRDGIACAGRKGVAAWRWPEIASITTDVTRTSGRRGGVYIDRSYILRNSAGAQIGLNNDALEDVEGLADAIKRNVYAILGPQEAQYYQSGQPLSFGPITVSRQDGIQHGGRRYGWDEIVQLKVKEGLLRISTKDGGWLGGRHTIRTASIPNVEILCQLLGVPCLSSDLIRNK